MKIKVNRNSFADGETYLAGKIYEAGKDITAKSAKVLVQMGKAAEVTVKKVKVKSEAPVVKVADGEGDDASGNV